MRDGLGRSRLASILVPGALVAECSRPLVAPQPPRRASSVRSPLSHNGVASFLHATLKGLGNVVVHGVCRRFAPLERTNDKPDEPAGGGSDSYTQGSVSVFGSA